MFLFFVVKLIEGFVFFIVFFFLIFCLFNSFLIEKLIGNFGVWVEFVGLLLFWFGLDISDLMLKDIFLVVVGLFCFIVFYNFLKINCCFVCSIRCFSVSEEFLECLFVLLFLVLVWN